MDAFNFKFEGLDAAINQLQGIENRAANNSPVMLAIEGILVAASDRAFINQEDPSTGEKWAPLSEHTANNIVNGKRRGESPILQVTGALAKLQSDSGPDFAQIGSPLIYAGVMHFGAEAGSFGQTKNGRPIPWGDIPARGIVGADAGDIEEIGAAITSFLL